MDNLTISKYVQWIVNLNIPLEEQFYPSLWKKLLKDEPKYKEIFYVDDVVADKNFMNKIFLPLYDKEIVSRSIYRFKPREQKDKIFNSIDEGRKYRCFSLWTKDEREFIGGTLHFTKNDGEYISLRVFDKTVNKNYKFNTTIDYWAEKKFRELVMEKKSKYLSHGKAKFPNTKYTGISLFKIKNGAKPRKPKTGFEMITINLNEFKKNDQASFFDKEDENGYFQRLNIFYKKELSNPSLMNEFQKVCDWANIELRLQEI